MSAHAQPFSVETLIDILIADPERFQKKEYVEKGVPMFLIGEDLTGERLIGAAATIPGATATDRLGDRMAELAATLALRKPTLDLDDVARLLEVLAERHFTPSTGATEPVPMSTGPVPTDPAHVLLPAGAPPVLGEMVAGMASARAIRLVNFHATPRYREAEYRRQIEDLARVFAPITPANFADAVGGRWSNPRPGIMPALFEGYRDNLDVLLPILEEFGFTGWFFVPPGFLNVPPDEQRDYAGKHRLHLPERDEYPGQRIVLSWDEAREIARRGHVFACHTRTHHEVKPETPRAVLEDEIVMAKAEMEAELGQAVEIFCWLEGAAIGVNPEADAMLREHGFRYLFSNFKIQRIG